MRIVSGKARGLTIKTIDGNSTRPTRDMVREALFNIIFDKVSDSVFLDLFAGSGAVGIEALSRGAEKAYFIDNNKSCTEIIKQNLEKAKLIDKAVILYGDYLVALEKIKDKKFDIIFVDPPYHKELGISAIEKIAEKGILAEKGFIIYETDSDEEVSDLIGSYKRFDYRKYGRNILNFYG